MKSIWKAGRRPKVTGNVHVDVARLPIKNEILEGFFIEGSDTDPAELALRGFRRIIESGGA